MEIQHFFDPQTFTLTYVVFDPSTRDAVVIDPVLDYDPLASRVSTESADAVSAFVQSHKLVVRYALETHAHADHLSASQLFRRRFDARTGIGARITEVQETFKQIFDFPAEFPTDGRQFDRLLKDGEVIEAGSLTLQVIATPGHTPACVTFKIEDAIFTGDALFIEDYGTGRCDFPRGSAADLYGSVHDRLYTLPGETRVFPGHDYQPNGRPLRYETTVAAERERNIQLTASTARDAFIAFRAGRDAKLTQPRLLYPSVQVNVNAGRLPPVRPNGRRYFTIPLDGGTAAEWERG